MKKVEGFAESGWAYLLLVEPEKGGTHFGDKKTIGEIPSEGQRSQDGNDPPAAFRIRTVRTRERKLR